MGRRQVVLGRLVSQGHPLLELLLSPFEMILGLAYPVEVGSDTLLALIYVLLVAHLV